ncbi:MAG: metal dependent phosphohydrolase [Candidatus Angelobacter sp.]|jgi:HD-GYP domain-containing protein (c-di-GMP phosphodiesterase class II)|nr:metal dependent phosphohydrolase [Candidatus Angelobacter sp.]
MDLGKLIPARIPILYSILAVLILVGVVPLYWYGTKVVGINKDRLKTNEKLLQNTVTSSLADDITQRQNNLRTSLDNLSSAIQVASGNNLSGEHVSTPELRALLDSFVSKSDTLAYATILNSEAKGITAGRMAPDPFMQRELEHAFQAARENRSYNGQTLTIGTGKDSRTIRLVSSPITVNNTFIGMVGAVVDLDFLIKRLQDASQGGLDAYVVDSRGRLVASATKEFVTGQDMTQIELVKNFVDQGTKKLAATSDFTITENGTRVPMLGTCSPVSVLEWGVVAEKTQADAYASINEMQRTAQLLAVGAVFLSLLISFFAARRITTPLEVLTESSRAIARGDFTQRVHLKSRTEIGELAQTFNAMSDDLERFVFDLKRAAEENRALFLSSIQMLAGAVDEKDPYTRGHSDRVTRYSVILAKEMGLLTEEIERIRISAQLHDVGKIGIEDRILKKPGALTPEEFEVMKTHTVKGGTILRPVEMLKEMIPGIELHHESLDGRGYPYGLKGDALPLMPRIIMVADTFDAMTTNRPYQAAMDPEYVVRIINSLANTKFDPRVVAAITSVFERGALRLHRAGAVSEEQASAAAAASQASGTPPAGPPS